MSNKAKIFHFLVLISFLFYNTIIAQKEIKPLFPADGMNNVNTGILKWSAPEGFKYDLYFGQSSDPSVFKSDLDSMEVKPVIIELNKKYYWKVALKKDNKIIKISKVFSFTTLPVNLNPNIKYNYFVDNRDYKVYWTMTINNKEWFVQNLDYEIQDKSWYYDNSQTNKVYGKLYHGELLSLNTNNICPEGWHIPSEQEWLDLINTLGGINTAGAALKESTTLYWRNSNSVRNNNSGMTILPAGSRDQKPSFSNLGKYTFFWTSTPNLKNQEYFSTINLGFMRDNIIITAGDPKWSYSIRCVKDK